MISTEDNKRNVGRRVLKKRFKGRQDPRPGEN